MKAEDFVIASKKTKIARHDLNGHFELLIEILKLHAKIGVRQYDKTYLLPINLELSIATKLRDLKFNVSVDKFSHIIQISW